MRGHAGTARACRSPYGERGLKSCAGRRISGAHRRSPYGERGLKLRGLGRIGGGLCRSPYGERGLKSIGAGGSWLPLKVALLTESVD